MAFERERQQMIADIESGVAATRSMTGRDQLDPRVLEAMRHVPREDFVPDDLRRSAFRDGALPVGHGQTISQPYMVAIMTDLLELTPHSVVLEIGTGTGYQAAILAQPGAVGATGLQRRADSRTGPRGAKQTQRDGLR